MGPTAFEGFDLKVMILYDVKCSNIKRANGAGQNTATHLLQVLTGPVPWPSLACPTDFSSKGSGGAD